MPFLAPLAIAGLAFIPLIVAFYMLRLRREERTVSSTYLWQQLVRDVEANAPWQRLRRSLLLLLQLLLVLILVLAAARPFLERPAGLARDLVLVMDASASMGATDVFPDRLTAAKRAAAEALAELPSDGRVSIVAAGETARVVANEVSDRGASDRAHRRHRALQRHGRHDRGAPAGGRARLSRTWCGDPRRDRRRRRRGPEPCARRRPSASCPSGATGTTRPSRRWPSRPAPAASSAASS